MLLGIALHAAIAYQAVSVDWPVVDSQTSPFFDHLVGFTHGFRMPLFFVLGGFFAAMLWQKRGLRGLLRHRAKRILLPLAAGCLTIVPAVWAVAILGTEGNPTYGVPESNQNLWVAAAKGDNAEVGRFIELDWPLDEPDPFFLQTPMAWAIYHGHPETLAALLQAGADPNAKFGERGLSTHLHGAAFFGRSECARLLLAAGADTTARNRYGETPADSMRHGEDVVAAIAQTVMVTIDFEDVAAGREVVGRLLDAEAASGLAGRAVPEGSPVAGGGDSGEMSVPLRAILMGLMMFPFFHHLWFLWVMLWLVAGLALAGSLLAYLKVSVPVGWRLVASPLALVWLVPVTAVVQSGMFSGIYIPAFGPDTSAGLLPVPHVLAYYAVFFGFGALVYVTPGAGERLGDGWWALIPLGFALYPAAHAISTMSEWGYVLAGDEPTRRILSSVGQALFCWLMLIGSIGICRRLLSAESRWMRYLSDSSYWLYLAHLPLVILGQRLLEPVALPGLVKFTLLLVATTALLLASYEWCVRYTFIGTGLNGPRKRSEA